MTGGQKLDYSQPQVYFKATEGISWMKITLLDALHLGWWIFARFRSAAANRAVEAF